MEKYIELDTEDSLKVFFDYSAVFHYWFNGPHRDRLMNYLTNEYLTLLAEEMDPSPQITSKNSLNAGVE